MALTITPDDVAKMELDPTTGLGTPDPPKNRSAIRVTPEQVFAGADPKMKFGATGSMRGVDVNDYDQPWVTGNTDNDALRAQRQSALEQAGNFALSFLPRVAAGLVEGVATVGDLDAWSGMINGEGSDFNNPIAQGAREFKDWWRQAFPIYRERPSEVWDMGDSAWWLENVGGGVESLAEFAALGAGIGGAASRVARGVASVAQLTAAGELAAGIGAQVASSAALTFAEGAMEARDVYKNVYNERMALGLDETVAKSIASRAAATTARVNMLNTAFNITALTPLFRTQNATRRLAQSGLIKEAGEDLASWGTRIATQDMKKGNHILEIAREAASEGAEEVVNTYASREGTASVDGDRKSAGRRIVDTLLDPEAHLAAVMGAVMGGATPFVMNQASRFSPNGRVKGEDGTFTRQTANQQEHHIAQGIFTRDRDALVARINTVKQAQEDLVRFGSGAEANPLKYQEAQSRLFATTTAENITSGTEQAVIARYKEIGQLTSEEAAAQGFVVDPDSPDYYKTLASQKEDAVKHLSKKWEQIQNRYGFNDNERLAAVDQYMFNTYVARDTHSRNLENIQKGKAILQTELNKAHDQHGTTQTMREAVSDQAELQGRMQAEDDASSRIDKLNDALEGDSDTRQQILTEFGMPMNATDEDIKSAIEDTERSKNEISKEVDALTMKGAEQKDAFMNDQFEKGKTEEEAEDAWQNALIINNALTNEMASFVQAEVDTKAKLDFTDKAYSTLASAKGRAHMRSLWDDHLTELLEREEDDLLKIIDGSMDVGDLRMATADAKGKVSQKVDDAIKQKEAELGVNDDEVDENADAGMLMTPEERAAEAAKQGATTDPNADPDTDSSDSVGLDDPEPAPDVDAGQQEGDVGSKDVLPEALATKLVNLIDRETDPKEIQNAIDFLQDAYEIPADILELAKSKVAALLGTPDVADDVSDQDDATPGNIAPSPNSLAGLIRSLVQKSNEKSTTNGQPVQVGFKVVEGSSAVAFKSVPSTMVETTLPDGTVVMVQVKSANQREEGLNPITESNRHLQPGSKLTLRLATDYNGPVYRDGAVETMTYAEVLARDGIDNVPIEIIYTNPLTGQPEVIGYVHESLWIDKTDANGNPVNVAGELTLGSAKVDNFKIQKQEVRRLRKEIAERGEVDTKVTSRSIGTLSRVVKFKEDGTPVMRGTKPATEYDTASKRLPDTSLVSYIFRGDRIEIGPDRAPGVTVINGEALMEETGGKQGVSGHVGFLLPTNTPGVFFAAPLWMQTLGESASVLYSMIYTYAQPYESIKESGTPFDVKKGDFGNHIPISLSRRVKMLTGSRSFTLADLRSETAINGRVRFSVSEKYGTVNLGEEGGYLYTTNKKIVNEQQGIRYLLDEQHMEEVAELMSKLHFNADLGSINKQGPIMVPSLIISDTEQDGFTPSTDPDTGVTRYIKEGMTEHADYNEYLKSVTLTDIDGTHVIEHPDGVNETSYFEQGTIVFSRDLNPGTTAPVAPEIIISQDIDSTGLEGTDASVLFNEEDRAMFEAPAPPQPDVIPVTEVADTVEAETVDEALSELESMDDIVNTFGDDISNEIDDVPLPEGYKPEDDFDFGRMGPTETQISLPGASVERYINKMVDDGELIITSCKLG